MIIGTKVYIREETPVGIFDWEGVVTKVTEAYVETKHSRSWKVYPGWGAYARAYVDTWTKHYFHPDGKTNLKLRE